MALFCTPCLQSRFQVYIPTVWYNLHSVFRALTIILTYKDCPSDKRGLRRTQIRHLARWVRTLETFEWWSTTLLVIMLYLRVVNMFSVLLCGKAVDQPVPSGIWGGPPPWTDHGGPVGTGPVRWRGETLAAHRELLLVSHVFVWFTVVPWKNCIYINMSKNS